MGNLGFGYGKALKHTSSLRQAHICRKSNLTCRYTCHLPVFRYPCYALTLASSNFNESDCSTALLAKKVAMAIWSAEAHIFNMFNVTGTAVIMTFMQRSPEWVVCMRHGMVQLSVRHSTGSKYRYRVPVVFSPTLTRIHGYPGIYL